MNTTYYIIGGIVALIIIIIVLVVVFDSSSSSSSSGGSNSSQPSTPGNNTPPGCGSGAACPSGQTCVNSTTCTNTSTICSPTCSNNQTCINQVCVNNPSCKTNSDCTGPNQQCDSAGNCVNVTCTSDSQCSSGYFCNTTTQACVEDNCSTMGPAANNGQACYHNQIVKDCTITGATCGTGYTCDTTTKYCIPSSCSKDADCLNTNIYNCDTKTGTCSANTCSADKHCNAGEYCSNTVCNSYTSCGAGYPCPVSTDTCYMGMCVPTCNYQSASDSCGKGYKCIPSAIDANFTINNQTGICLVDIGDHLTFTLPTNINCGSTSDCPDQGSGWTCNTTSGFCEITDPTGTSCEVGQPAPIGYTCSASTKTIQPYNYKGCVRWQQLNPSGTSCSSNNWTESDFVDIACLGVNEDTLVPTQILIKTAETDDSSHTPYNTTPVVFRLGGMLKDNSGSCPSYPLFGFYNSNGNSPYGLTTFDLNDWYTFDVSGALNSQAKASNFSTCSVIEAAYLTKSDSCSDASATVHIPAWTSLINEHYLTYDGSPFCYNIVATGSIAPVNGSDNAPASYSQLSANACRIPSDVWGSGTLDMVPVWASDGLNKN